MTEKSRFNVLFKRHLRTVQEKTGLDQQQLGAAIGGNRNTVQAGQRIKKSISYEVLVKFYTLGGLDEASCEDLKDAWFEERLFMVKDWGETFKAFSDIVRPRFDDDEFKRVMRSVRDTYLSTQ